jgi:hypothetical protein
MGRSAIREDSLCTLLEHGLAQEVRISRLPTLNRASDLFVDVSAPLIFLDGHQEQGPAVAALRPDFPEQLFSLESSFVA